MCAWKESSRLISRSILILDLALAFHIWSHAEPERQTSHYGRTHRASIAKANTSAAISNEAARLAIAAIATYQVLLIVLIFLRSDLDPSWHTISEWAIGPRRRRFSSRH